MRVIEYFSCDRQEHWLRQIGKSDWTAGQYLHRMLSQGVFSDFAGKDPKLLLLTEGDELIAFCTYTERDDVPNTELRPWMGFVYTFPRYRGHRYTGHLFQAVEALARAEHAENVYITTGHVGLYEKYGCEFYQMMDTRSGEPSRVYRKHIDLDHKE